LGKKDHPEKKKENNKNGEDLPHILETLVLNFRFWIADF
jgi:hypothetical protein